jgi:hypothetical protein
MTNTIEKIVQADADGNVVVPLGPQEAGTKVRVTITPHEGQPPVATMTREEYEAFVRSFVGSWVGDFEEPANLPLEKREQF